MTATASSLDKDINSQEYLDALRHSCAHVMATAILLEAVDHAERVNESAGAGGTNQGNQLHTAQLLPQQ